MLKNDAAVHSEPVPEPDRLTGGVGVPPTALHQVTLSVRTNPSGASILRDGVSVGVTPADIAVPAGKVPIMLVFAREGFRERSVEVTPDRDRVLEVELQKAGPSPVRVTPRHTGSRLKEPAREPVPHERLRFK